jgi:hypothetical protein
MNPNLVNVTDADADALVAGRHPKWQRVEPGTVIPAGQPYRIEWDATTGETATEYASEFEQAVNPSRHETRWLVDSSWRPPLELPTEPTWGIVVRASDGHLASQWVHKADEVWDEVHGGFVYASSIRDFIPLTDEQAARIEQAR